MQLVADLEQQAIVANTLMVILGGLGFCAMALWIWMAVDCLLYEHDSTLRTVWLLVLLFGGWLGALCYFFIRRRERLRMAAIGRAAGWQRQPQPMAVPVAVPPPAKPLSPPGQSAGWSLGALIAVLLAAIAVPVLLLVVVCVGMFVVSYWHMHGQQEAMLEVAVQRAELPAVPSAEMEIAPISLPPPGVPVAAGDALAVGDELLCEWAGQWHRVQALELLPSGDVKIRWIGWSDAFDEVVPRFRLRRMPTEQVAEQPDPFAN